MSLRTVAGRERFALGLVPLDEWGRPGRLRILAERDDADLESYAVLDGGASAMLVWNIGGVSSIEIKDLGVAGGSYRIDLGQRVLPGWSVHRDGRSAILELSEAVAPRSLYHVDLVEPAATTAGSTGPARTGEPPHRVAGLPEPALPRDGLVAPDLLTYRSSDGLQLQGLLYRPHGTTLPLPTVVLLHGGPESQERPAFSILIQSLVAAGMAVFAPNVRGSTGYGSAFVAMDDLDRRESSFQDVPATVRFLTDAGFSIPGRIGVHGWSYGGYLALVALTRWPTLFASGSSHAGMSDLLTFFAETEPWMAAASVTEYGDPVTDRDLLTALSPIHQFGGVHAPTLLVHGEQDTNVPVGESVRAHVALQAAGKPTEMLLLPGEGHTIVGHDGRISSTRAIVEWHARWTG
ncbi:MAG: prolyl oligopeptidase family serine peptidase [Nakamurella sp.]